MLFKVKHLDGKLFQHHYYKNTEPENDHYHKALIKHILPGEVRKKKGYKPSGLQITAGQQTMSGQNWVLTEQILGLPDILFGPLLSH